MDRRRLLAVFGKTLVSGAGWLNSGLTRGIFLNLAAGVTPLALPETEGTLEAHLQADMTRLSTRVYSEEGIPMILACEDLTAKVPVVPASKAMNLAMAPAFQRYVKEWHELHPDAPTGDVAKLAELLAWRDFNGHGKDTNL